MLEDRSTHANRADWNAWDAERVLVVRMNQAGTFELAENWLGSGPIEDDLAQADFMKNPGPRSFCQGNGTGWDERIVELSRAIVFRCRAEERPYVTIGGGEEGVALIESGLVYLHYRDRHGGARLLPCGLESEFKARVLHVAAVRRAFAEIKTAPTPEVVDGRQRRVTAPEVSPPRPLANARTQERAD